LPTGVALAPINWGLVINDITKHCKRRFYKKINSGKEAGQELYNTLEQQAKDNKL
jgi:hypothetical protein